jgi:light-regulated signal transduction histidine kinase (bacteriophytochrome)
MGGLIDGLLRYSQLCRESMEDGEVDMTDLVHAVAAPLRMRLGEPSKIVIGILPATRGDARLLRQVWQIYLDNAVKFSSRAEAARIQVGGEPTGDELVYWVRDNGVGFDSRYAHKLFTAFQRLHPPESFEGAGVGLALAKRMVESHGGRVWAEGCPGEGATFYFSLPAGGAAGRPSGSAGG